MTDDKEPDPDQMLRTAMVRLLPRLRRFCLAITASPADADDLSQSTCERAIAKLDHWTPGTRLDSWLYRIAQNLHKNSIRDHANRRRILNDQAIFGPERVNEGSSPAGQIEAANLQQTLLALPCAQREVLILTCVEGYSYRECAALLNLPETTVTNRLYQARLHLRNVLDSELEEETSVKGSASA